MAHNLTVRENGFVEMAYFGDRPWHGLGQQIEDETIQTNAERFQAACGNDWNVETFPIFGLDGQGNSIPMSDYVQGVRRCDNGLILGSVGPAWQPLQNKNAFEWFQPFLDSGLARLVTGGSIDEGRQIWAMAEIKGGYAEIRDEDSVVNYLMLSNSHDGTTAVRVGFTPIRIVCQNTLRMATSSKASKLIRIKHGAKTQMRIDQLQGIVDLANQEFVATAAQFQAMAGKDINAADLKKYVRICLMGEKDATEIAESDTSTRMKNLIEQVCTLAVIGKGNEGKSVWDAYNGVTEYYNWVNGRNNNNRMKNLWFGTTQDKMADAFNAAMALVA